MQHQQPSTSDDISASAAREIQRAAFRDGVRAFSPAVLAVAVWGLVTGVAMVKMGLTQSLALGMTLLVYAGSSQLTALPLIMAGAPIWLIFAASTVVNLRFVIFSAAFFPFFRQFGIWKRLLLGYFTSDLGFVVFIPRFGEARVKGTPEHIGFFWGLSLTNWTVWQVSSIVGIFIGTLVPSAWSLEFAAVLALTSIVVPMATSRPMVLSIVVAAVAGWLAQPLPLKLGLVVAVVAGVTAGMLAERAMERRAHGKAGH